MRTQTFELSEEGFIEFDTWIKKLGFVMVERGMNYKGFDPQTSRWIRPRKGEGGAVYYIFVWPKTGYIVVVRTIWLLKEKRVTRDTKRGWVMIVPISDPDYRAHSSAAIPRDDKLWDVLRERTIVAREVAIGVPKCPFCGAPTIIAIDRSTGRIGDRHFVCSKDRFHNPIRWDAIQHSDIGWKRLRQDRQTELRNRKNPRIKKPGSARIKRKRWKRETADGNVIEV